MTTLMDRLMAFLDDGLTRAVVIDDHLACPVKGRVSVEECTSCRWLAGVTTHFDVGGSVRMVQCSPPAPK